MATIGSSGKHSIYVVRSSNPIPASSDVFIDYTGFFVKWNVRHKLQELAVFSGTAAIDPSKASPSGSGTRADDIKAGNYIYIMSGTKLISKFVINKPIYDGSGMCEITGEQSSGRIEKKSMSKQNTAQEKYNMNSLSTIFFGATGINGICEDLGGSPFITNLDLDDDTRVSFSTDYTNRVSALTDACNKAQKEWVIEHGENDTTPYSEGDGIRILNRAGSGSSVKTFVLDGSGRNANICSGAVETESAANHIIMKGRDQSGKQVEIEQYNSTNDYVTNLSQALDGWLAEDITATDTSFSLKTDHGLPSSTAIFVKIDNEIISGTVSGDTFTVTNRGTKLAAGSSYNTTPVPHRAGSDVILARQENLSSGGTSIVKINVDDETALTSSSPNVVIGGEIFYYNGNSGSGYIEAERFADATSSVFIVYAHGDNAPIFDGQYTLDSPDTDDNSIYTNGLITKQYTDNTALNIHTLDMKAYAILTSRQEEVQRIAIDVSDPIDAWSNVNSNERSPLGSKVTLSDTSAINISAGSYRVVEYEYSWPIPKLILYLNDDDIRCYSTGSYDVFGEYDAATAPSRSSATRGESQQTDAEEGIGTNSANNAFTIDGKSLSTMTVPMDAWDDAGVDPNTFLSSTTLGVSDGTASSAASVGYVKALVGSSTSDLWTDHTTYLAPTAARDVYPYDSSGTLGASGDEWDQVWCNECRFPYGYIDGDATSDRLDFYCTTTKVAEIDGTNGFTCGIIYGSLLKAVNAGETTGRVSIYPGVSDNTDGVVSAPTGDMYLDAYEDLILVWDNSNNFLIFDDTLDAIFTDASNKYTFGAVNLPFDTMYSSHYLVCEGTTYMGGLAATATSVLIGTDTSVGLDLQSNADMDLTATGDINIVSDDDILIDTRTSGSNVRIRSSDNMYLDSNDNVYIQWGNDDDSLIFYDSIRSIEPSVDGVIDLGGSGDEFDRIYCCDIYGTTHSSTCDLAELQFVAPDVLPGDVVELADWEGWEKDHFDAEVDECKEKQCDKIKFLGYQGRWVRASRRSTKCPSVISVQPGHTMGSTERRLQLYEDGKMNYVALSGSIPFVFITGGFVAGDTLVSAGDGKAMADNNAPLNQVIGYAKRSGQDERCEIWVR